MSSEYVIVRREPTEEMLEAAAHASMQHLIDCINDPARAKEVGSEKMCRLTHASRFRTMLAASPRPQSVLSHAEIANLARDAQIKFCLQTGGTFEEVFARAIEAAVLRKLGVE